MIHVRLDLKYGKDEHEIGVLWWLMPLEGSESGKAGKAEQKR